MNRVGDTTPSPQITAYHLAALLHSWPSYFSHSPRHDSTRLTQHTVRSTGQADDDGFEEERAKEREQAIHTRQENTSTGLGQGQGPIGTNLADRLLKAGRSTGQTKDDASVYVLTLIEGTGRCVVESVHSLPYRVRGCWALGSVLSIFNLGRVVWVPLTRARRWVGIAVANWALPVGRSAGPAHWWSCSPSLRQAAPPKNS